MIKIGIEVSCERVCYDLLMHPERYFSIIVLDEQPYLCIRTCDLRGEDMRAHIIDGLAPCQGGLSSVFEDMLKDAVLEITEGGASCDGDEYPLTYSLVSMISKMPDLVEWLVSSFLGQGRSIVLIPC